MVLCGRLHTTDASIARLRSLAALLALLFTYARTVGVHELLVTILLHVFLHHFGHVHHQLFQWLPSLLILFLVATPFHQQVNFPVRVNGPVQKPVDHEALHVV